MTLRLRRIEEPPAKVTGLADVYPPYREKMEEYRRAASRDMRKAENLFAEDQEMAKAFWAGQGELAARLKAQIVGLIEDGALGEFAARRIMRELGIEGA